MVAFHNPISLHVFQIPKCGFWPRGARTLAVTGRPPLTSLLSSSSHHSPPHIVLMAAAGRPPHSSLLSSPSHHTPPHIAFMAAAGRPPLTSLLLSSSHHSPPHIAFMAAPPPWGISHPKYTFDSLVYCLCPQLVGHIFNT